MAPRYGGPSEAIIALTRELRAQDIDVEVATTDADGAARLPFLSGELVEWRSIPVRFFSKRFSESYKYSPSLAHWLRRSVGAYDLVHVHAIFSHSSVAAVDACRRLDIPYIVRPLGSLDPSTLAHHRVRKQLFYSLWGRAMLRGASAVHYSTQREMALVEERFATGRGFVAAPGVEMRPEHVGEEYSRGESLIPKFDSDYVLFLGRIHPIKKLESLIDGFAAAIRDPRRAHWQLVVAGEGESAYVNGLRRRAAVVGGDRIRFCGWLSGKSRESMLRGAAVLALTSLHENFGRAAVEAMLAGVPVLVSENVFISDEIANHDAGWIVSGGAEAITKALVEIMREPELRRCRAQAGKVLARSRFDSERSTRLVVEKYHSITASQSRRDRL